MSVRSSLALLFVLCLCGQALASPLDDRIAAFNDPAVVQDQAKITQILQAGVKESRSAEALAAVQVWLNRNDLSSGEGLFYAGQAAERSGQWLDAIGYYQRLLNSDKPNAQQAGEAVDATYRLLVNVIADENAAYQFMRKDGNRIRAFGQAKRYDRWFLDRARAKRDLTAVSERLETIAKDNKSKLDTFQGDFEWLCTELEHFRKTDVPAYEAVTPLAAQQRVSALFRARLNWVAAVMPYNLKLDELRNANAPADPKLTDAPLAAAAELIKVSPDHAITVAKGWGIEYDGHHGTNAARFRVEGERKLKQLLAAVPRMSPDKRDDMLAYPIARGRVKFDVLDVWPLVIKHPESFNAFDVAHVPLFDKAKLTVEQAKQLAPHLSRNPHPEAAMIRAIAGSGSLEASKIAEALMKTEAWRFAKHADAVNTAWGISTTQDVEHKALIKQYGKSDPRFDQLKKQIDKKSDSKQRLAAFNTLYKDLTANAPTTPGAMVLWDELFANAPDADLVQMIKTMVNNTAGERGVLLAKALAKAGFGKKRSGAMPWQPVPPNGGNQFRYHRTPVQEAVPELIAHLQGMIGKQVQAGTIDPMVFGMWLHTVDTKQTDAIALIQTVVKSPAYAKLDKSYHASVADGNHFGMALATPAIVQVQPSYVSRELLALPDDASPQAVEAALAAVIKRVQSLPAPVAVLGLEKVAAQKQWSDKTRQMVLSLFKENAPIGSYPSKQGYEPLVERLADDAREQQRWAELEPYLAGIWLAAEARDHHTYEGVPRLVRLAESALEAEQTSIAISIARSGLASKAGQAIRSSTDERYQQLAGRLSQVQGKAAIALGIIDIPVDELDPAYPIYKSQAEFAIGNLDAAWELYEKHSAQVQPVIRKLTVPYCLWLLERDIEARESERAEALIKELTVWSRQASGTFTPVQEGELKIAYADAAFQKGALQTAKAWYRRVADSEEFKGKPLQYEAQLRSVRVDRAGKDFGSALAELDKLMLVRDQDLRTRVHFARAEVFYDQERYADSFAEASSVLKREPSHPDALILLGQAQLEMRKLVDASEIELGVSRDQKLIVPGEAIKINLSDPALNISGVGADIEVEVWTKSGDRERVMLYQLGDDKTKFRAEIPTTLGKRQPGDKVLQILGRDEIRYGYSKRFREKMADLPDDPDIVITVASDARMSASAGAFPAREGERRLDLSELGVSSAQQALGTRQVRPGNPVYLRINDPDQGKTDAVDQIAVSIETSNGDIIPRLILKETGPYTGEFEAAIPTGSAQALAYASESAPGRDANMVISAEDYPGWAGAVGSKSDEQFFTIDLNDNVLLGKMQINGGDPTQALTHFVVQTSLNGKTWQTRARYPKDPAPWDGRPTFESFHAGWGGVPITAPKGRELPADWRDKMATTSSREACRYAAAHVPNLSAEHYAIERVGHPNSGLLVRFRAYFYQPAAAIRTFRLAGFAPAKGSSTVFLIDGKPVDQDADDPNTITRELAPGLHNIEVWRTESRGELEKTKPQLLTNVDGQTELVPCPDDMFDPATFPAAVRETIAKPTSVKATGDQAGAFEIDFGQGTRARLVRLAIVGHEGPTPAIKKITLTDHEGGKRLPVAQDYNKLRANGQLEVVPGDRITVRYEDDVVVSDRKKVQQRSLSVAFNTATIAASFLTYETNSEGERRLVIEPIRRFKMDDNVGLVINDPDLDQTPERDQLTLTVKSSSGAEVQVVALETGEHTGEFLGKVFPVSVAPKRDSEIQVAPGGTITAIYRDQENLDPGIPTDRVVTIEHALFKTPGMAVYDTIAKALPTPKRDAPDKEDENERGPEIVKPRQSLSFAYVEQKDVKTAKPKAIVGSSLRFDVLASYLAFAESSEVIAYVQTESGRRIHKSKGNATGNMPFDIRVPGTLRLVATPSRSAETLEPAGYQVKGAAVPPDSRPPLDEGRFAFSVPIMLDRTPLDSFATADAQTLPSSMRPEYLAVRPGDTVHIGFAYLDDQGKAQWLTTSTSLDSHAFIDVMNSRFRRDVASAFVGEKLFVRVIAPDRDKTPERDEITVNLIAKSGAKVPYMLRETEVHSGVFKGSFGLTYADKPAGGKLPSVALHGLPVKYGDTVTVSYDNAILSKPIALDVSVNKGADGGVEPFTKQYGDGAVAVQTTFTLAECFFELAKHHRKMKEESLSRRQMGHAQKLLAEAVATHRDEDLQAHAEYLLGNLAQEYADLSENEASKKAMYQDALARFSKIPLDYPDSEFAPKAQFKKGLVYEKLGEVDIAVEEYVKLAYKYPDHELIPSVMSRLGSYFQAQGKVLKLQAESLEQDENNTEAMGEALKLREKMAKEYRNAAQVFKKLQDRFPTDPLAGLAGLRSAQNFLRAGDYQDAIDGFQVVIDTEQYDGKTIRSQAMFWAGISYERLGEHGEAYKLYRRTTFDFSESVWAKQSRGRLADPVFAQIISVEEEARKRMLEALKEQ